MLSAQTPSYGAARVATTMTLNGFTRPSLIEGNSKHATRRRTVRKYTDHGYVPWMAGQQLGAFGK